MLELDTWEEIALIGVCAIAAIIFLIMAVSAFKLKNQKVIFWLALGIAFCFAVLAILCAWKYVFFQG